MNSALTKVEQDLVLRFVVIGLIASMTVAGAMIVGLGSDFGSSGSSTTYIYHNSTVYINTTSNTSVNHYDNTTTYVNTTDSRTVYVNTTYVVSIPVVVVTSIAVDFVNDTSMNIALPANYSLPVGTVTWIQFNMTTSMCQRSNGVATVNTPWTMLFFSQPRDGGIATMLIGVPYETGIDTMVVSVN